MRSMRISPYCVISALHLLVLEAAVLKERMESIDDFLHASLTSYDLLQPVRLISRRGAGDGAVKIEHLHFNAFNEQFHVTLQPQNRAALMQAVKIVVLESLTKESAGISLEDLFSGFYTGYIDDDPNSHVSGYVSNGRIHLTIERGNAQVLNIEPLSLLTGNRSDHRLLAYYDAGINGSQYRCGLSDTPADVGDGTAPAGSPPANQRGQRSVIETAVPMATTTLVHVCRTHVVADHTFVAHIGSVKDALRAVIKAVDDVNVIFQRTTFTASDGATFTGIGFELGRMTAFVSPFVPTAAKERTHFNAVPQPEALTPASHLLQAFGDEAQNGLDLQGSCLAHLVTFRRIADRVLGLAYSGSAEGTHSGGVCSGPSPSKPKEEESPLIARNTGLTTFRNRDGPPLPTRQATLVMAHELAHNMGATHDPPAAACRPGIDRGGAFLMHEKSVSGEEPNHSHLSPCSTRAIGNVVQKRLHGCLIKATGQVCGNGRLDRGEVCDAGPSGDACCDPSCRLRPGASCSDGNAPCCQKCGLAPAGTVCRRSMPLWPCHSDSVCTGRTDTCPEMHDHLADGAFCLQGAGVCRNGVCHSLCQQAGRRDCRCQAPSDSCQVCCAINNGTCSVLRLDRGGIRWSGCTADSNADEVVGGMTWRLWRLVGRSGIGAFGAAMRNCIAIVTISLTLLIWVPLCLVHDYRQYEYF